MCVWLHILFDACVMCACTHILFLLSWLLCGYNVVIDSFSLSISSLSLTSPPPPSLSEQEVQLQSLRANQQDLEARNSSILKRNQRLQEELDKKTQDLETAIANSSSSSSMLSTNHPSSLTHITATIDLDLSKLRSLGVQNSSSSSTSVSHHASAIASVPLQFNSQYCSTMEEGL